MKMRKLLSIGALTLAVVSCTSIGASAAEVAGQDNKKQAMQAMVQKGLDGGNVFDAVSINAKTSVGKYLTATFIEEINTELKAKELNKYTENGKEKNWEVKSTDNYYAIQKNIAKTIRSLEDPEKRDQALKDIKEYLQKKLKDFEDASSESDEALKGEVTKYLIVPSGSTLTVGSNSDNLRVVSLEKNGKIIAQINSGNVYKAAEKLDSVENYEQLKSLIMTYYPDAEKYFNSIK